MQCNREVMWTAVEIRAIPAQVKTGTALAVSQITANKLGSKLLVNAVSRRRWGPKASIDKESVYPATIECRDRRQFSSSSAHHVVIVDQQCILRQVRVDSHRR